MICDLKSKSIWLHLSLFVVLNLTFIQCLPRIFRTNEICGAYNGHRVYLELGDRGDLQAKNVTVPYIPSLITNDTEDNNSTYLFFCSLEMVTCPACRVKITLKFSNFPQTCSNAIPSTSACECDYLLISEPRYDPDIYGKRFCGQDFVYESKTRSLNLKLFYSKNNSHAFTLEYQSERNRELISGSPGMLDTAGSHNKMISSPFFPSYYPRDYGVEHVLTCKTEACRVHVLFTDFQISTASTMEFYDWNGQRIDVVSGMSFRPPVIISSGQSMLIRFHANGGTDYGYKAKVSFVTLESSLSSVAKPFTNCGGYVDSLGGAITMMNMVDNETDTKLFDCIWLIKPPNTYLHLKTHLSLRVAKLDKLAGWTELVIRQGLTSDSPILEEFQWPSDTELDSKGFSVAWSTGFYVRLKGLFSADSEMALVYTAFSYTNCYQGSEFACLNHRCVPIQLQCDGFDHCSDNSDENPENCQRQWSKTDQSTLNRRRWYAQNPNYYFPKIYQHPDLRMATTMFLVCSMVFLVSSFIMLLYKTGVKSRLDRERELQSQLQTISELLDNNRHIEPDEPPIYEAPPNYEDIIKIGMDNEMDHTKKMQEASAEGRKRSRSPRNRQGHGNKPRSRKTSAQHEHNSFLEVVLPLEEGSPENSAAPDSVEQGTIQFLLASRLLEISEANNAESSENEPTTSSGSKRERPTTTLTQQYGNSASEVLTDPDSGGEGCSSGLQPALSKISSIESSTSTPNQHIWSDKSRFRTWRITPMFSSQNSFDSLNMQKPIKDLCNCSVDSEEISSDSNQSPLLPTAFENSLAACICSSMVDDAATSNVQSHLCPRCKHHLKQQNSICNNCTVEKSMQRVCVTCGNLVVANNDSLDMKEQAVVSAFDDAPSTSNAIHKTCICYSVFPKPNFVPITFVQAIPATGYVKQNHVPRSRYALTRKSNSQAEMNVPKLGLSDRRTFKNRSFHEIRLDNEDLLLRSLRDQNMQ